MALIQCAECGRTISDKATACAGCGAPLPDSMPVSSAFNLVPERETPRTFPAAQVRRHALLAAVVLALGISLAIAAGYVSGLARIAPVASALLIIVGLCWLLVVFVQSRSIRK